MTQTMAGRVWPRAFRLARPAIALSIAAAAAGSTCGNAEAWQAQLQQVDLRLSCNALTLDIRIYQDNVERVRTGWGITQSSPGTFDPSVESFGADRIDFGRPVRIRVFVARVDGECPPFVQGEIHYFPNANGWAPVAPAGGGYSAGFGTFDLIFGHAP